jgi:RHS repeat-associated protein
LLTKLGNGDKHNSTDNSYQKINQYYNHANHIGSVNVITDHKGKEFKYIEYTPYGEQWFSESTTDLGGSVGVSVLEHGYTDHLHDEETGLIYANARYLDPKTSRWLSGDPAMQEYLPLSPENKNAEEYNKNLPSMGGIYNSRNLQTYHYAGNNPLKYVDPTGEAILDVFLDILNGVGLVLAGVGGGPGALLAAITYFLDSVNKGMASANENKLQQRYGPQKMEELKRSFNIERDGYRKSLLGSAMKHFETANEYYGLAQKASTDANILDEIANSMDSNDPNREVLRQMAQARRDEAAEMMLKSDEHDALGHEQTTEAQQ